jgi:hypothetical protein
MTIRTRTDRIREQSKLARDQWPIDHENIRLMAERASKLSDGDKHRAKSGELELPDTNRAAKPEPGRWISDPRATGKQAAHSGKNSPYIPGVRRFS